MKVRKYVLITRPKDRAQKMLESLENKGNSVFIEPLFSFEKIASTGTFVLPENTKISAVILTSANACDAIIDWGFNRDVKVFSVGEKTSQKLRENGFKNIVVAPEKNAESLLKLIKETYQNKSDLILYFHGSEISLDFEKELTEHGFLVKKILAYRATELESFSPELLRFSKTKNFDEVFLFSQNSARVFMKLARKHNLLVYFASANIICLSEKILKAVKDSDQNHLFQNLSISDFQNL